MIEFKNVSKLYKSNIGLQNVTVTINEGDFVFLVGPSGAGKTTFVKLILKELEPETGIIRVHGKDITHMPPRQIPQLRRSIGIVFQDFRLLPRKNVYENVAFAMEITHAKRKMIKKQVPMVLSMMGISQSAKKYPDELSAGEQQRVAIARAIVNQPKILIADEPTGNLDPDTAWEIMQLLDMINRKGTTILMVTHARDIVDRMEKRVIAIENGRIVRDEFGVYGYQQAAAEHAAESSTVTTGSSTAESSVESLVPGASASGAAAPSTRPVPDAVGEQEPVFSPVPPEAKKTRFSRGGERR